MTTEHEEKTTAEAKRGAAEAGSDKTMCEQMAEHCGPTAAKMMAACCAKTTEVDAASKENAEQKGCC